MCLHKCNLAAKMPGMTTRKSASAPGAVVDEWRTLLDRHAKVSCALEKSLQDRHAIGLSEFEILDRLVDANCGKSVSYTHLTLPTNREV